MERLEYEIRIHIVYYLLKEISKILNNTCVAIYYVWLIRIVWSASRGQFRFYEPLRVVHLVRKVVQLNLLSHL